MPSNELKFRSTEETRIIKAMLAAGLKIARVEKDAQGRPVYVVDQGAGKDKGEQKNDFDSIYDQR